MVGDSPKLLRLPNNNNNNSSSNTEERLLKGGCVLVTQCSRHWTASQPVLINILHGFRPTMTSRVERSSARRPGSRPSDCVLLFAGAVVLLAVLPLSSCATSVARPTTARPGSPMGTPGVVNPAFVGAGRTAGLEIWRIENFEAVKYPKNNYGKFHTGDSYIVLFTKQSKSGEFSWDIHFWLGNQTSQDESGAAAIMSVELDDQLGGGPVQHREVQEHESQLFLSYFPSGVRYLAGGVASGFTHVDPNAFEKRLFKVKGKRNVRVIQVELKVGAMNKGDVFILDAGREIYVYTGPQSKRTERLKAISAANQIRDQDHAGRAHVTVLDEFSTETEINKFFQELGSGSPNQVPDESAGGDDEQFERNQENAATLWKVSDASGSLKMTKVGEKPLNQNLLKTEDTFILDTGNAGIFVWIGKGGTRAEKTEAMKRAQQFLATNNYPAHTQIKRVVELAEPSDFRQYFSGWRAVGDNLGLGRTYTREQIAATMPGTNASSLHSRRIRELTKSGGKAFGFMPDDGSGQTEIYRVEDFELAPIDKDKHGIFFGGDSYVIKYTYNKEGREHYIIYFWQGNASSQDEKAASAIQAVRLDNELNGRAVQVRVTQGEEPRHFLRIFKGKMIVFMGGRHSGFRNLRDHDSYDVDGTRFFQVRGTCEDDVRAVQVPEVAASLNSDDVFVLETPSACYIWFGKGSSDEEKEMARKAAQLVVPDKEPVVINEGEEPEEFWAALGGKGPYTTEIPEPTPELAPRLFHCQIKSSGKFFAEELRDFQQEDLVDDDIMLLDSGEEIYVWVGSKSSEDEKLFAIKMAKAYLKHDPTERNHHRALIFKIKQGDEPYSFTSLFPNWDPNFWESQPSYEDVKNQIAASNAAVVF